MSADDVREVAAIPDPATRARVATELLSKHQEAVTQLARIRRKALAELQAQGLSLAQVGNAIGVTRGRIAQLRTASHLLEQEFFGGGAVTITTPLRGGAGAERPLVAQEDAEAAALLAKLLDGFDIDASFDHVDPTGKIDLGPDGLVAICGPKSSPAMREIIETDPIYDYSPDTAGDWRLVEQATGKEYRSPIDTDPTADRDIAYFGRLRRPDGRPLLVIAGIHAIGSLGAVAYLSDTEHVRAVHNAVDSREFSMVVGCRFTRSPLKILEADALTEPQRHGG